MPPTLEQCQAAHRTVHNLAAFFHGLQDLDAALQVCLDAMHGYPELVAQQKAHTEARDAAIRERKLREQDLARMDAEFQQKHAELDSTWQADLAQFRQAQIGHEAQLKDLETTMHATRLQIEADIEEHRKQVRQAGEAEHARCEAIMQELLGKKAGLEQDIHTLMDQRANLTAELEALVRRIRG